MPLYLVTNKDAVFPVEGKAPDGVYGLDWDVVHAPSTFDATPSYGYAHVRRVAIGRRCASGCRLLTEAEARAAFAESMTRPTPHDRPPEVLQAALDAAVAALEDLVGNVDDLLIRKRALARIEKILADAPPKHTPTNEIPPIGTCVTINSPGVSFHRAKGVVKAAPKNGVYIVQVTDISSQARRAMRSQAIRAPELGLDDVLVTRDEFEVLEPQEPPV